MVPRRRANLARQRCWTRCSAAPEERVNCCEIAMARGSALGQLLTSFGLVRFVHDAEVPGGAASRPFSTTLPTHRTSFGRHDPKGTL